MKTTRFSHKIPVFHSRAVPEPGILVGYGAIIEGLHLKLPWPNTLVLIGRKARGYQIPDWKVFGSSYEPEDSLYHHLVFALKYEGINLLFFKLLFDQILDEEVITLIQTEPSGQYSRKIWFLFEWLMKRKLSLPDLGFKNYVSLIDEKIQYAIPGTRSSRHRIINNLPGTPGFCPLIFKTDKLESFIGAALPEQNNQYLKNIHADIVQRTSAFLLLKDSTASFTIEGEPAINKRLHRWGQAIGQAGVRNLDTQELMRLQEMVIADNRLVEMGFRKKGGFVGDHNRETGEPLPDHISARWEDLDELIEGLLQTSKLLEEADIDAVIAASSLAFGFVFIHPFQDGNGRIHRYLIHHILSIKRFSIKGMIFPISASILNHIHDYRQVLESYSHPLMEFIDWKETPDHNIEVLGESIDYYRYYDATKQAEFLYECVEDTIRNIIPEEINYLQRFDEFKREIDSQLDLPDKLVSLLVRFLGQGSGKLSKRAREKEFKALRQTEIDYLQSTYQEIFSSE